MMESWFWFTIAAEWFAWHLFHFTVEIQMQMIIIGTKTTSFMNGQWWTLTANIKKKYDDVRLRASRMDRYIKAATIAWGGDPRGSASSSELVLLFKLMGAAPMVQQVPFPVARLEADRLTGSPHWMVGSSTNLGKVRIGMIANSYLQMNGWILCVTEDPSISTALAPEQAYLWCEPQENNSPYFGDPAQFCRLIVTLDPHRGEHLIR